MQRGGEEDRMWDRERILSGVQGQDLMGFLELSLVAPVGWRSQ